MKLPGADNHIHVNHLVPVAAARILKSLPTISKCELSKHTTADDCWVAVGHYVYDVTRYLPYHEAGAKTILRYAGTDISYHVQFHSSAMMRILKSKYLIGRLVDHSNRDDCNEDTDDDDEDKHNNNHHHRHHHHHDGCSVQ